MAESIVIGPLLTDEQIHEGYVLFERWFRGLPGGIDHGIVLAMAHFGLAEVLLRMVMEGGDVDEVEWLARHVVEATIEKIRKKAKGNDTFSVHG